MGRHQESFAEIKRALEIDPTSAQLNMIHGMALYLARYYERAVEELEKAVEIEPQHVLATFYLGIAHVELGHFEEALAFVERSVQLAGGAVFFVQGIGYVHASAGRKDLAQGVLVRLDQIADKTYISPFFTALITSVWGTATGASRQWTKPWRTATLGGIHQGPSRLRRRPDRPALRGARREAQARLRRAAGGQPGPALTFKWPLHTLDFSALRNDPEWKSKSLQGRFVHD